jgi:hypothetical protein
MSISNASECSYNYNEMSKNKYFDNYNPFNINDNKSNLNINNPNVNPFARSGKTTTFSIVSNSPTYLNRNHLSNM